MPSNDSNDTTEGNDTEPGINDAEKSTYAVYGWAETDPIGDVVVPVETELDDLTEEQKLEALRDDLRSQGYPDEVIEKLDLEVDYVESVDEIEATQ